MKEIIRELVIPKEEAKEIKRILSTEPKSLAEWEELFGGMESTRSYTPVFGDGMEMDIQICGVVYEKGSSNRPWTQAVLFKNSAEVCCSEPEDYFFGEWELERDGVVYKAIIKEEA